MAESRCFGGAFFNGAHITFRRFVFSFFLISPCSFIVPLQFDEITATSDVGIGIVNEMEGKENYTFVNNLDMNEFASLLFYFCQLN